MKNASAAIKRASGERPARGLTRLWRQHREAARFRVCRRIDHLLAARQPAAPRMV